jgi:hypothetical protein
MRSCFRYAIRLPVMTAAPAAPSIDGKRPGRLFSTDYQKFALRMNQNLSVSCSEAAVDSLSASNAAYFTATE